MAAHSHRPCGGGPVSQGRDEGAGAVGEAAHGTAAAFLADYGRPEAIKSRTFRCATGLGRTRMGQQGLA
jgi:hypothetical protein